MHASDLARDIPVFVMYCIYGASRSSLLVKSTDSMIIELYYRCNATGNYMFLQDATGYNT